MIFNSESDLVNQYLDNRKGKKNSTVITELNTNFGRPDIVIIHLNEKILDFRRENIYKEDFLRKYSYILSFLYSKGWVSLARIKAFFTFTDKEVHKIIGKMEVMRLVDIKGSLVKSKPSKNLLTINRLEVVEAKLTNWKYVIEQAERHLWFSEESSVLLPNSSQYIIEKSLVECNQAGIGLYIVEEAKNRELLKPPSKGLVNTPLLWELNEKLVKGDG